MLKPQWWVNCQQMAKEAMKAVHDGSLQIFPALSEKEWFKWLENIQDWCISRQLWWGHTIPAYFIRIEGQDQKVQIDEFSTASNSRLRMIIFGCRAEQRKKRWTRLM
jgi:valyl-tRNA synthetase